MTECFIGLGSNLEDPRAQVLRAFGELDGLPSSTLLQQSSLYQSAPLGPQDQDDFINAVARLRTSLEPADLLSELQHIESDHRRVRERHWGPRTLDLDILLYGDECIETEELHVPHREMSKRNFVLVPLFEIAPDLSIPGIGLLSQQVALLGNGGLMRLQGSE